MEIEVNVDLKRRNGGLEISLIPHWIVMIESAQALDDYNRIAAGVSLAFG